VAAPFSFSDYAAGRDPAIDSIMGGKEMRSIPLIALNDGGQKAVRRPAETTLSRLDVASRNRSPSCVVVAIWFRSTVRTGSYCPTYLMSE